MHSLLRTTSKRTFNPLILSSIRYIPTRSTLTNRGIQAQHSIHYLAQRNSHKLNAFRNAIISSQRVNYVTSSRVLLKDNENKDDEDKLDLENVEENKKAIPTEEEVAEDDIITDDNIEIDPTILETIDKIVSDKEDFKTEKRDEEEKIEDQTKTPTEDIETTTEAKEEAKTDTNLPQAVYGSKALAAPLLVRVFHRYPGQGLFFPGFKGLIATGNMGSLLQISTESSENKLCGFFLVKKESQNKKKIAIKDLEPIGVLAKLVSAHPGGQMEFQCLNRIKLVETNKNKDDLSNVKVEPLKEPEFDPKSKTIDAYVKELKNCIVEYQNLNPFFPQQLQVYFTRDDMSFKNQKTVIKLVDFIAYILTTNQDVYEIQEVLASMDMVERMEKTLALFKKEIDTQKMQAKIRRKVDEKFHENQRKIYLLEQLKAIKKELGMDTDERETLAEKYRRRLETKTVPKAAMKVINEELNKLQSLDPASAEYGVTRNYLDWLTILPWGVYTTDIYDVKNAQQILDEDHYGLKKVKERILEFIAVGKLKGSVQGKMLCFVGPPGVGKTSIGRSIARALGREFHRFSVGGMRDVAEIKGHRRTYIGSMPGKLIQIFKLCKSSNPVIMIDEIDKLAKDYSGDPASALLEVLDPEQNNSFLDHYLDVPFDLSKVLFLCTANMTDTIPEPLLDRMEVLNVSGYIATEKLEIAKRHLIPKITNEFGLKPSQFRMKDEIIHKVIYGYCREAGVRNLQKTLEKIARQIALKIALGERSATSNKEVTEKNLIEYLGNPMFTSTRYYERSPVGVCMGLAWTSLGGTSMYIETSIDKGKSEGSLKCTGNMRDVMKESSSIAYTVAKKILADKQPNNDFFEKYPIHMHTPEGATPKDGPSAGCAMVTALLSLAMNKPVKNNLAMTGEITLTGKVLQIGGVREKTIGAKYAGVNEIILPQDNKRDWEELEKEAPEVTKGMTVHFASYYEDIYKVAFEYEEETTTPKKAKRTRK